MGFIKNADEKEVLGKTDHQLFDKKTADGYRRNDREVMKHQVEVTREETTRLSSGKIITLLSTKRPILDNVGKVVGIAGNTIDITYLKQIETALHTAKQQAEAANQAKSAFISNMEHDLRTPFSGIHGIASLLYDKEQDKEKKALLALMMKSCQQWENVHHRIFDSLVVENPLEIKITSVSIPEELQNIQEMMASTLQMKGLTLALDVKTKHLHTIQTDKVKFGLILSSLISNAIKFTNKGHINIVVLFKSHQFRIQVIDPGIGIPEDKFEYIFEKFTKLSHSNKHGSNFQGLGLGLYTAKHYADQLGMRIHVESTIGKGSIFTIEGMIALQKT